MPRPTPLAATLFLLLGACSAEPGAENTASESVFAGAGRDRLCLVGEGEGARAGLISYAQAGDANCSASGSLAGGALVPRGDPGCRIPLMIEGDSVRIGAVPAACAYYCGPGATLPGKTFRRSAGAQATDLAGDPLC